MMLELTPEQIASIKNARGIVFDCDGVLLNSRLANISFYNRLRHKAGLPDLIAEEEEFVHMSTYEQALEFILMGTDRSRVSDYLAEMEDNFDYYNLLKVEDYLLPMLEWLKNSNFRLGICTNRLSPMGSFLERFGLDGFFNPMQTASNSTPKPSPDGLFKAAAEWDMEPGEIAYIGDSRVDEEAANAAGMPFWAFKNPELSSVLHVPGFKILQNWLEKHLPL